MATAAAVASCWADEVLPEHRYLALNDRQAGIVKSGDEAAALKEREWTLAVPSVDIPAAWPSSTNDIYVTDVYWSSYCRVRELDPKATFTVPATLCSNPKLSLSAWERMPIHGVIVRCTSGDREAPPARWFLDRGFRVRLDGKDIPVKTTPSLGAEIVLELSPTAENPRNSEGDFVWLKDGTLLFAWSRFYQAGKHENGSWDNGGADIACRRSSDGGRTWSGKDEILIRNTAMNLMSVSFLRLADGRIALFYIEKESAAVYKAMMRTSADEAKTWSDAVEVTGVMPRGQYCLNNARVIQLKTGRILAPLAYHPPKPEGGNQSAAKLFCVRSDDGGRTWAAGAMSEVFDAAGERVVSQEPGVIELKDGRVMMWTRTDGGAQYAGYSSDGGVTWSAFKPTDLKGPLSPATIKRLKTDELIAIWNDHRGHPERGRIRAPLSIALSRDEGRTWSPSVTLEENLTDFLCYTALVESGDDLLLAYCTKRERNLDTLRLTRLPRRQVRTDIEVDCDLKDEAVEFAAKDLRRILRDVPGRIVLKEETGLRPQEWRFKTEADGALVISGSDGMGIVYGVYEFLERSVGCLWLAQDTEILPDLTGWTLPALDERRRPAYEAREMYVGEDMMDGVWRLRNKESVRAAFGVGVHYGRPRDNHTFEAYSKLVKEKHPELFGNRRAADGRDCKTLCMTDPRMRHAVAAEMMEFIRTDRERRKGKPRYTFPTYYSLEQDDGGSGGECMCPGCKALFEAEGSYAGPSLAFANAVADEVCAKYPDVKIQWDAYSYTMPVPKTMRASSNVVVRLSNSWYLRPLLPGSDNGEMFLKWREHAHLLSTWGYWRTYKGMLDPCVIPRTVIRDEIRFLADNGVVRYFAEDEDPLSRNAAMLQHWLYLKLADDPTRDFDALLKKFMDGYYGKAAPAIDRFLTNLETRQEESREFLDRAYFETANACLDEAEQLAKDDPRSLRHVRWERVVTDRAMYHYLGRLQKQGYADDFGKVAERFARNSVEQIETWSEFQFSMRRELLKKRLQKAKDEADLYAHYPIPLPPEFAGRDVIALEWNQITLSTSKSQPEYVKDPDAAAGTAFYNAAWKPVLPLTVGTCNPKTGTEFPFSFVAPEDPRAATMHPVPQDEKFHLYKIGTDNIMVPLYIHFDNPWHFRHYFQTLGILGEVREIWLSMKFQGPTFVKGSTQPDRVLFDRILLVKPENPAK